MALNFDQYVAKGKAFIKRLALELGHPEDTAKASRKLRAVLHAVRDRLTIEESMQLLAQLPMFLKALYVDQWHPGDFKRIKHVEEFLGEIRKYDQRMADYDFANDEEVENAARVVFMVLRKHISLGEMEGIRSVLPKELKFLVNNVAMI